MGNGALPHGPSYRAHPRLYLPGRKLRYTKWLNLRQLLELSGREMGCGSEDFGLNNDPTRTKQRKILHCVLPF
jgi:hypothetical protein